MNPSDIARVHAISHPQVHPDGGRVVFAVARPDLDEDHADSALWLWDGNRVRQFTRGPHDHRPRWSPDGRRLAFLRKGPDDDDRPQVMVMAADGGEPTAVTDFDLGASEAEWAPDGEHLAVIATTWRDEPPDDEDDEERARRPRRVTRLPMRADGQGWLADRHAHVWLVDPAGTASTELTQGPFHDHDLAWHPDGDRIAFLSSRHDPRGLDAANQVFEVTVAGGEPTALVEPGLFSWVGHDHDGTTLVGGLLDPLDWPGVPTLWRLGPGGPEPLLGELDRTPFPSSPAVTPGGVQRVDGGLVMPLEDRGTVRVVGRAEDGTLHDLVTGDRCVVGLAPGPTATATGGGDLYVVVSDPADPGELHLVRDGRERRLTSFNEELAGDLRPAERFAVERDGVTVDAWAVCPDGAGPWPVLLNVHGGPTAQYADVFFDEFQVYAAAGYLVVGSNPRGSSGRGTVWARAVVGTWDDPDSVDMLDLRAVVDATLARFPAADRQRVGIMGGSYGGFATARIIARDRRFASAVVERALLAWESFAGTSDIGAYFDRMFLQASPPHDWERLHAASPLALAADVAVPTLVLHSEEDWRCPVEQAEQYFVALLRAGVEAELLRFPGEGHELSRSGSPRHRVERFEAILDWHARHLA